MSEQTARSVRRIEQTSWTRRLAHVPDFALHEELQRRGAEADTDQAVHLPGLVVDPVAGQVVWRGDGYVLGGRQMEIVYALALAHAEGRRRLRSDVAALVVFRGFDLREAVNSLRSYLTLLDDCVPGLVVRERGGGRGTGKRAYYGLALDEVPASAEAVA